MRRTRSSSQRHLRFARLVARRASVVSNRTKEAVMKALVLPAAFVAVVMFIPTSGFAQQTRPKECPPQSASAGRTQKPPEKIEGQVTQVDPKSGTLTVRRPDGGTQQFRGSKETVEEYKVGDTIELTLRHPC